VSSGTAACRATLGSIDRSALRRWRFLPLWLPLDSRVCGIEEVYSRGLVGIEPSSARASGISGSTRLSSTPMPNCWMQHEAVRYTKCCTCTPMPTVLFGGAASTRRWISQYSGTCIVSIAIQQHTSDTAHAVVESFLKSTVYVAEQRFEYCSTPHNNNRTTRVGNRYLATSCGDSYHESSCNRT
jgi:hypothetical protein